MPGRGSDIKSIGYAGPPNPSSKLHGSEAFGTVTIPSCKIRTTCASFHGDEVDFEVSLKVVKKKREAGKTRMLSSGTSMYYEVHP